MSPRDPWLRAPARLAFGAAGLASAVLLSVTAHTVGGHFLRSPLARDAAQFQFVAWAISRGAVDYRDLQDLNAPMAHALHWLLMHLGGLEDGRFRVLESAIFTLAAGFAGWALPRRSASPWARGIVALAMVAAFFAEYLRHAPWHLSQRDAFALWFLLPSMALAADASSERPRFPRLRAIFGAAALVGLATTLKPFFVLFAVTLAPAVFAATGGAERRRAALAVVVGGVAGGLPALAFTLVFGDLGAYLREGFVLGPLFYKGIYDRPLRDIVLDARHPFAWLSLGLGSAVAVIPACLARRRLRSVLPLALGPPLATAVVLLQHKGFPYHVHVVAGLTLLLWVQLFFVAVEDLPRRWTPAVAMSGAALAAAAWCAALLPSSGLLFAESLDYERLGGPEWESARPGPALAAPDYYPLELRLAARWLREHTPSDSRVFVYGHDIAVLTYARRRSAVATLTSSGFDVAGLLVPPQRATLDAARVRGLEAAQRDNIADALRRLRDAPAACVLIDHSPWMTEPTALADLNRHAPELEAWLVDGWFESTTFGPVHVWQRRAVALSAGRRAPVVPE